MKPFLFSTLLSLFLFHLSVWAQNFEHDTGTFLDDKGVVEFGLPPHYHSHSRDDIAYEHQLNASAFMQVFPDSFVAQNTPLSELFYQKGALGLQSARFLHAQNRKQSQFNIGIHSEKRTGWLSNQTLKQQQGQFGYTRGKWSLYERYTYHLQGANGGDTVPYPNRKRQIKRNDLEIAFKQENFSATIFHQLQETKLIQTDTLWANTHRGGVALVQHMGKSRLLVSGWLDVYHKGNLDIPSDSLYPQATVHWNRDWVSGEAKLNTNLVLDYAGGAFAPSFDLILTYRNWTLEGGIQPPPDAWILRHGFTKIGGTTFTTANGDGLNPIRGQLTYQKSTKQSNLQLGVFGMRCKRCDDFFATTHADSIDYKSIAKNTLGTNLNWGFNTENRMGIWADVQGLFLLKRDETLPQISGEGKLGYGFKAFQEDLNARIWLGGKYRSAHFARTLHTPTGLWAIPYQPTESQKGLRMDAGIELGIRDNADIRFFAENLLNQSIEWTPGYSLPKTWIRGEVVWRIKG